MRGNRSVGAAIAMVFAFTFTVSESADAQTATTLPADCQALITGKTYQLTELTHRHFQCAVLKQSTQAADRYSSWLRNLRKADPNEIQYDPATHNLSWTCVASGALSDEQRTSYEANLKSLIGDAIQSVTLLNSADSAQVTYTVKVEDGPQKECKSCACHSRCRIGLLGWVRSVLFRWTRRSCAPSNCTPQCNSQTMIAASEVDGPNSEGATPFIFAARQSTVQTVSPDLSILGIAIQGNADRLTKTAQIVIALPDFSISTTAVPALERNRIDHHLARASVEESALSGVVIETNLKKAAAPAPFDNRAVPYPRMPSPRELAMAAFSRMSDYDRELLGERSYVDGCAEFWKGRYRDALKEFDSATMANPRVARYWYFKGLAEKHLGLEVEFENSIRTGAKLVQADFVERRDVYRSLERVQGSLRIEVERLTSVTQLSAR